MADNEYAADADMPTSNVTVNDVLALARDYLRAEMEVKEAEEAFERAKARLKELAERTLPAAMEAVGMTSVKLDNGATITMKPEVYASISEADQQDAADWLTSNGHGGIIKHEFVVTTPKGCGDFVDILMAMLRHGIGCEGRAEAETLADRIERRTNKKLDRVAFVQFALQGAPEGAEGAIRARVHPQTLRKFVREVVAAGGELPPSIKWTQFNKAHVKVPVKTSLSHE